PAGAVLARALLAIVVLARAIGGSGASTRPAGAPASHGAASSTSARGARVHRAGGCRSAAASRSRARRPPVAEVGRLHAEDRGASQEREGHEEPSPRPDSKAGSRHQKPPDAVKPSFSGEAETPMAWSASPCLSGARREGAVNQRAAPAAIATVP